MNVGVVLDVYGMDETPFEHEEYLVELHYNYYRNDPIKYLVAIVLSSWGVNQYLLAVKMSLALVES